MIISRSQQTTESVSRDWADKSGIWGEGLNGEAGWGLSEAEESGFATAECLPLSVMEFGKGWEGRQLTGTRTHTS